MPAAISTQEITITRVFDAPRELVWKAWTEPDQLAQWWGPPGWTNRLETLKMDVRPGGAFRITSVSDEDGTQMTTSGAYREVLEPERLVLEEPGEDAWHDNAVSVVTLTDLGDGRTEIVLHATIQTTEEMRAHAEAGMVASLDRLAEHLA